MALKLYGVPLSQPYRAVAWLLLIKKLPFNAVLQVPGMKVANGTRNPEFMKKFPSGTIPAIEEADGFALCESHAIMPYLCTQHGWEDYYPTDAKERAMVDQLLHWHHHGLRQATIQYVRPLFRPDLTKGLPPFDEAAAKRVVAAQVQVLEDFYLPRGQGYLAGGATPTIADLSAYQELNQLEYLNLFDFGPYPEVRAWLGRMKTLPAYDAVHAGLAALGDQSASMGKALGGDTVKVAVRAGVKAIGEAAAKNA